VQGQRSNETDDVVNEDDDTGPHDTCPDVLNPVKEPDIGGNNTNFNESSIRSSTLFYFL